MTRIVVAVDPPVSVGPGADACGIVAAGLKDGMVYVLEDASARGLTPLGWAERAVGVARVWGAGRIVAEGNQGGEMVREVLWIAGAAGRSPDRVDALVWAVRALNEKPRAPPRTWS